MSARLTESEFRALRSRIAAKKAPKNERGSTKRAAKPSHEPGCTGPLTDALKTAVTPKDRAVRKGSVWTHEFEDKFIENYPKYGVKWCCENMGLTAPQVRAKASRLGLVARGVSEAWKEKQDHHSRILSGRKRPEQAEVMKGLHSSGKLRMTEERAAAAKTALSDWRSKNPHPRGAQGMTHTDETKEIISKKSRDSWINRTEDERAEILKKQLQTRSKNGTLVRERPCATWRASWREIGGKRKYFRSRWEANYARYLQWLKENGEIKEWEHEPETFWFDGIKRGCVSYLPDFRVTENDNSISYHEVKGWMDDRSKTKIARMAKYHPSIMLIVICAKQYRAIARRISALIDGWEK
jgi:hypothetical protein